MLGMSWIWFVWRDMSWYLLKLRHDEVVSRGAVTMLLTAERNVHYKEPARRICLI